MKYLYQVRMKERSRKSVIVKDASRAETEKNLHTQISCSRGKKIKRNEEWKTKLTSGPSSVQVGDNEYNICDDDELDYRKTSVACVENLHVLTGYMGVVVGLTRPVITQGDS